MKRFLTTFLTILFLLALGVSFFGCDTHKDPSEPPADETVAAEEKRPLVLYLGDSIGESIAGISPLTEREAYGYYGILGNCNGFEYYNRAVTGYTTGDLAAYVMREDDGVNMVKSLIEGADLIHISITGNDFLNSSHAQMMIDLAGENYSRIRSRQETAAKNLEIIFDRIYELNPDVTILVQTLYNPTGPDSPLVPLSARGTLSSMGVTPSGYHALMGKMIAEINKILTDYLEAHTVTENGATRAPFRLVDVYSVFERIYETDPLRWSDLFCRDGVHPNDEGHALMAGVLQEELAALGLASPNALQNYKRDKVAQLRRLFADLPTIENVRAAIMRASTFDEVTKGYFDGTRGILPTYQTLPQTAGETFAEDKVFDLTLASVYGFELTGLLDGSDSGVTFLKDGTYELKLTLSATACRLLSLAIASAGSIDLGDYFPVSLMLPYIHDIAPAIDPTDLAALLDVLEELYLIKVEGLDFEKPCVQEIQAGFRARREIILTDPDTFDEPIRVTFSGRYRLQEVTNPVTGEKLTEIYVNNGVGRSESYIRYTYKKTEDEERVRMTVDVVRAEVEGVIYAN